MQINISYQNRKDIFNVEQYCKDENINLEEVRELLCYNNQLTELNGLDKLVNLRYLYCYQNKIKALNGLDKLVNLEVLYCYHNKLTELKLNKLTNLRYLYCYQNKMIKLRGLFDKLVNLKELKK